MGGRAVGSAASAGCGAFSLLGVLVGVGLTVWLGSQALSGGGGGGGGGSDAGGRRTPSADPSGAIEALDALDELTASGAIDAPSPPGLKIVPGTGLVDGVPVAVVGTGLPVGIADVVACLSTPPTSLAGIDPCDPATARQTIVEADGALVVETTAVRALRVKDTPYDCAAAPGACEFRVTSTGSDGPPPTAPIIFAENLQPIDAERAPPP